MKPEVVLGWLSRACFAGAGLCLIAMAMIVAVSRFTGPTPENPETVHVTAAFTTRISQWQYESPAEVGTGNDSLTAQVGDRVELTLKTTAPTNEFHSDLTVTVRPDDGQPDGVLAVDEDYRTSFNAFESIPGELQLWGSWADRPGSATIEFHDHDGKLTGTLHVTVTAP